jgi:hypothetical protein
LFHGFDTLGSHLREEGSLDYDEGHVRLQVQTKFDMHIHRQHTPCGIGLRLDAVLARTSVALL